jgi:hypothetical protein
MHDLEHIFGHTLMITGFVFVMMLVIEYLNVLTRGSWQTKLKKLGFGQYVVCGLFGVIPGCLGSFTAVSLYSHRLITFGGLVATMIATSGDAAFLMLAEFPRTAVPLFGALFAIGVAGGLVVDVALKKRRSEQPQREMGYVVHEDEKCNCFSWVGIKGQWRNCSAHRGTMTVFLALFLFGIVTGKIGHGGWDWVRATLVLSSTVGLFIVFTVPDHFLDEHLWNHVVRKHVPRIFLWSLGALLLAHLLTEQLDLGSYVKSGGVGPVMLIVIACLVGLIPDSGPHFVFVFLYAQGVIPISVLVASSIVQDGHGMLPMLAHSRRGFVAVKLVNMAVGLAVGSAVHIAVMLCR